MNLGMKRCVELNLCPEIELCIGMDMCIRVGYFVDYDGFVPKPWGWPEDDPWTPSTQIDFVPMTLPVDRLANRFGMSVEEVIEAAQSHKKWEALMDEMPDADDWCWERPVKVGDIYQSNREPSIYEIDEWEERLIEDMNETT
jgi:hypothetical protein